MGLSKLKEDLENCLITFDRRVLLTELLDDYDLPYEEVNEVVTNHLKQQENKGELKYEKRYVVHGVQEGEHKKEIFKIVAEAKLKEWLKKLKDAESSLYSVEVVGGAKAAADVFKPMKVNESVKIKDRSSVRATTSNGGSTAAGNAIEKKPIKVETKNPFKETSTNKTPTKSPAKAKTPTKTVSPPDDKKVAAKKGGINNFFALATHKKTDTEAKSSKSVVKPPTPKKMQDFFKKQTEKPKTPSKESSKNSKSNTSIQLFDSEEDPEEEKQDPGEVSSDEEEKIEALKRDIISSDVEMDEDTEETDNKPSTSNKRRRILDSDDDDESEDPPIKQEKLDVKEEIKEHEDGEEKVGEPETYLDEEGFVITKKPKQKASTHKAAPALKTPPVTMKTSPKESKKITPTGSKDNKKAKTKQAGIMSFFSKK